MKSISTARLQAQHHWMGDILCLRAASGVRNTTYGACLSTWGLDVVAFQVTGDPDYFTVERMETYSIAVSGFVSACEGAIQYACAVAEGRTQGRVFPHRRATELSLSMGTIWPLNPGHDDSAGKVSMHSGALGLGEGSQLTTTVAYSMYEYLSSLIDSRSIERLGYWQLVQRLLPPPSERWGADDRLVVHAQYDVL